MSILVAYASKYGATRGIAQRIAEKLRAAGQETEARPVKAAGDLTGYEAVVIGSAIYYGSWLKEAMEFVRRNRAVLAARPVWLFSSGPLGTSATDAQGHDLRRAAEPKELAELRAAINPRDHRVFFGALNRSKMGLKDRMLTSLPAARALFLEGDFRDWKDIEAWAESIAHELAQMPASGR
jgi:menaquinone-dependent protoporphyrinogen oxidase